MKRNTCNVDLNYIWSHKATITYWQNFSNNSSCGSGPILTAAKLWKLPRMLTLAMRLARANRMWAEATPCQFPALTLRGSGCLLSLLRELSTSTITTGYPSPSSLGPRRRNLVQLAVGLCQPTHKSESEKGVLTCDSGIAYRTANSD